MPGDEAREADMPRHLTDREMREVLVTVHVHVEGQSDHIDIGITTTLKLNPNN